MNLISDCLYAFLFGGALCVIGQLLIDLTKLTPARILVAYVTVGVFLGAIGVYAPLVDIFGCGATVPLTGFGYSLASGVKKAVETYGFFGIFSGGISGTALGITVAVVSGFAAALVAKPRQK